MATPPTTTTAVGFRFYRTDELQFGPDVMAEGECPTVTVELGVKFGRTNADRPRAGRKLPVTYTGAMTPDYGFNPDDARHHNLAPEGKGGSAYVWGRFADSGGCTTSLALWIPDLLATEDFTADMCVDGKTWVPANVAVTPSGDSWYVAASVWNAPVDEGGPFAPIAEDAAWACADASGGGSQDYPSKSEQYGSFPTLSQRLDDMDTRSGGAVAVQFAYPFDIASAAEQVLEPNPYATPDFRVAIFEDTSATLVPGIYVGQTTDPDEPKSLTFERDLPAIILASAVVPTLSDFIDSTKWLPGPLVIGTLPTVAEFPPERDVFFDPTTPELPTWYYLARPRQAGWAMCGVTEDNFYDVERAVLAGASTILILPMSPPGTGVALPVTGPEFTLVSVGQDLTAMPVKVDGDVYDGADALAVWAAGRFPDWNGHETFRFSPAPSAVGWGALPIFSAVGAPESTFTLQVTTSEGVAPVWFLSD